MRKSYKLYNHEYCKAHVEIHFDENNNANKIELWSYNTRVCGAYKKKQILYLSERTDERTGQEAKLYDCTGSNQRT